MANLYIVGTPIGNLGDITFRAIEVLKTVDFVLCEDTRVTRILLGHYGINAKAISYHAHSKLSRTNEIVVWLREGKNLALVSDAGMPGVSDPGSELVRIVREECHEEITSGKIKIVSVPGPSALTTALSIAGLPRTDFTFLGFLPHKKGRQTLFKEIAASKHPTIFYESPHRVMKTLEALGQFVGEQRKVTVCRELTKVFEEVVGGSIVEVREYFLKNTAKVRGEFVFIVD